MANEVSIQVTAQNRASAAMKQADQQARGLGNSTKRVGEIAAGVVASQVFQRLASAAKDAFVSTINSASNLNESVNAVSVTFGNAADGVLKIGETADQSMGLSQRAFNEAAVTMSNFAQAIAGDGGDVAGVIRDLTGRASDFASVMNLEVEEALRIFRSGLAGESEPLRRYGIDVSAAATETFAYANGIAEAGTELSEAQKVQARYGLIMEQTAKTQGDFANTSEDLANSQRIFKAEMENTQAEMGQNLLPVLAAVTGFLTDMLVGFQQLPGPVQTATMLIVGVGAAGAASAIGLRALGVSLTTVKAALGPIGIALSVAGALLVGLQQLGSRSEKATGNVEGLAQSLERGTGAITAQTREMVLLELQQQGLVDTGRELGLSAEDLVDAYLGQEDALKRVNGALDQAIEAGTTMERTWDSTEGNVRRLVPVLDDNAQAAQDLKDAIANGNITTEEAIVLAQELGIVTEGAGDAAEGAAEQVADLEEKLAGLRDELFETANEAIRMEEAEEGLADAIDKAMESSKDDEATKRDQREALRGVATASHDLILEMFDQDAATDDIIATTEEARQKFIDAADAMGIGQKEAEKLADKYGLIPGDVLTVVTLRDLASGDIGDIRDRLDAIDGKEARVSIINDVIENRRFNTYFSTFGTQGIGGQNAAGGNIGAPRGLAGGGPGSNRVLVGEHRPEVVDLPVGSRVVPSVDQAMDRGQAVGRGMAMDRYLELLERGLIRLGDVTDDEWDQLLALGWQGKAGDRMEALYPPLEGVSREFIKFGEVTKAEWQRLLRLGWQGDAGDRMEALYPPLDSLAVEAGRAAKLLRDANLNRISPVTGGRRTYDFFRSGDESFAHIFGTGETLALGQMGEMQAGDFLRAMGKIPKAHDGASVVGTDEGLAVLKRGEEVMSAQMVSNLERVMAPAGGGGLSLTVVNRGVIGNDHQLLQWLVEAMDELDRQGRLPGAA